MEHQYGKAVDANLCTLRHLLGIRCRTRATYPRQMRETQETNGTWSSRLSGSTNATSLVYQLGAPPGLVTSKLTHHFPHDIVKLTA